MSSFNIKELLDFYLLFNPKKGEKEFEIRFKPRKSFTKNDFDNVYSMLSSIGFKCKNQKGNYMLRLQCENQKDKPWNKLVDFSKLRAEINGISEIQKYCKSNQLTDINNVKFITKTNFKDDKDNEIGPYDNKDFKFRASLQLEKEITEDATINELITNWSEMKKYYRYINRIELVHDTLPLVFHLSIVKSSRKIRNSNKFLYEYTVQKGGVFDNFEQYEFEMEINEKMLKKKSLNEIDLDIKKGIKYFYSAIQDSNYPISNTEIKSVLMEYMNVIHNDKIPDKYFKNKEFQIYPTDFIGYSSYTLQMENIIPVNTEVDIPNIRNNYTVTEKADGERRLMFISSKGKCYFIDTNMNVQYTGAKTSKEQLFNSIIDGEFIKFNKEKELLLLYACFDIYYLNKDDKRNMPFVDKKNYKEGRLHLLEKVVKKIDLQYETSKASYSLKFEKKTFYYDNIFDDCKIILNREKNNLFDYNIDGLIFTPVDEKLPITKSKNVWEYSFKWKPPEFNTIDFMITINEGEEVSYVGNEIKKFKQLTLRCGFDPGSKKHGYINPCAILLEGNFKDNKDIEYGYKPFPFYPTNPYDENAHKCNIEMSKISGSDQIYTEENEVIENNTIVEFRYDHSKPDLQKWIPLRVRYDKTRELRTGLKNYGNAYHVANGNWKSIHNPITENMLSTGNDIPDVILTDDDVYYNSQTKSNETRRLRDFHNLVVKRMLIKSVSQPGDNLIDYAVGKAGDFPKWIETDIQFVFGIDKSPDNIENWIDGACARYLNYKKTHKNSPSALFVPGNSGLNIRNGDAIYDEQFKKVTQAVFGEGTKDATKLGKEVINLYGKASEGFDVSSCQFALHYFFETREILENFIQNIIDCTKVGGYFIGTSYDGKKVFNYLRNKKMNEGVTFIDEKTGKKIWEVIKKYENSDFKDDASSIGYTIEVYQQSINKSFDEFLINYDYFTEIMEKHGFQLLKSNELKELDLPSSLDSFESLFEKLKEDVKRNMKNKSEIGKSLEMNTIEKQISFLNTYFVYKKVRHDTVPVKLRGEYDDLYQDISLNEDVYNTNNILDDQEEDKSKMKIKKTARKVKITKN